MAVKQYGYTSKAYPFGSVAGASGLLPTRLPTKMLVSTSYFKAPGENIKIEVTQGKKVSGILQYASVVDTSLSVDLSDTEVPLSGITPTLVSDWQVIIKVSIFADEATAPQYNASEPVVLRLVRNTRTRASEAYLGDYTGPDASGARVTLMQQAAGNNPPKLDDANSYTPLSGIQTQFFARGTGLQIATVVSDRDGKVNLKLPPGSYDVHFYGGGFQQTAWMTGSRSISVGTSDLVTRFGDSASDVAQNAEFSVFKAHLAGVQWVGYMIPETFTDERDIYRAENVDPNYIFTDLANQEFGRIFRGLSYVDFVGVALDPGPY